MPTIPRHGVAWDKNLVRLPSSNSISRITTPKIFHSIVCPTSPSSVAIISFASFVQPSAYHLTRTSVKCASGMPKTCSHPASPSRRLPLPPDLRTKAISRDGSKGYGALPLDNTATAYKTVPPQHSTLQTRIESLTARALALHEQKCETE